MNIRRKVFLLLFACFILFFLLTILLKKTQDRQLSLVLKSSVEQQEQLVDNTIKVKFDHLHQLVMDYTNWDDLVEKLENPDESWAGDNIGTIVQSFDLNAVSVYDRSGALKYSFGTMPGDHIGLPPELPEIFEKVQKEGFLHYFRRSQDGVLEVLGSTVHSTRDSLRSEPGKGFFFISRCWNQPYLQELSGSLSAIIEMENLPYNGVDSLVSDSVITFKSFSDYQNEPVFGLSFHRKLKLIGVYRQISTFLFVFLVGLLISILGLFYFLVDRWIRKPLKIITHSLENEDNSRLNELQGRGNEFSQIADLIAVFSHQKAELVRENAERKSVQAKLEAQSLLLQGLADVSGGLLSHDDFKEALLESVGLFARRAGVDRISVYRNVEDEDSGHWSVEQVHDWINPEMARGIDPNEVKTKPYSGESGGWFAALSQGRVIKGVPDDFRADLAEMFRNQGVRSLMVLPVFDPRDQRFWGFVGFSDNSRERVWTETEESVFRMFADHVGAAIRRQITQEELRKAMEWARSADKAKSDFLASMSHEIRTPMNGVIGMTSLLLQTELNSAQREFVETIEKSGDSLLTIINEILDFSKIEMGRMELEEGAFDIRRCIEDVLDLLAPKSFEKRLELVYFIDPAIGPRIFGDGFRLRQILVNLIGNAIKFTEHGEVFLHVVKKETGEGLFLEFLVKDSGIGIPKDKLKSLFTPFSQVDTSTTRRFGGTGLGLAISANLVRLMKGNIWVDSEPGQGSEFRFTIKTSFLEHEQEGDIPPELNLFLPGKRVLVVDDNPTNRKILEWQFDFWKMKAVCVDSGAAALNLLESDNDFHAGILDMQMPDMDGVMLARDIRKRWSKKQLPLIMLTSIAFNSDSEEMRNLFNFYVNKPIKHGQLAEIVRRTLQEESASFTEKTRKETDLRSFAAQYPTSILIAEDNFINQKLIRHFFELLGYKVDMVANGSEAIEALKRKNYPLIFMDVQMPEMDGYEATRLIKERWKNDHPIIIAMTANAMQGDRERCLEAGMDDYISKPLRIDDITGVISRWSKFVQAE